MKQAFKIIFFEFILLILIPLRIMASPDHPREEIRLMTDRDIYVAGEEVHFKIYTLNSNSYEPVNFSDVVYLELLDRQHSPIIRKKFEITTAESHGVIALPFELSSERYYLRAYTNWMKNDGPSGFAYKLLTIINPFEEVPAPNRKGKSGIDTLSRADKITRKPPGGEELDISVKMDQESYGPRKKAVLEIKVQDRNGDPVTAGLVMSLVREGLLRGDDPDRKIMVDPQDVSGDIKFPPEWGGHIVNGTISKRNGGSSFAGDTLILSLAGKRAMLDYAIADSLGKFKFLVKDATGLRELVVQNVNPSRTDYLIQLTDPFLNDFLDLKLPDYSPDTNELNNINQAVINAQITALYEQEDTQNVGNGAALSFYGIPDRELNLADYIPLPEMREVFFELIPSAQMRGRSQAIRIRLRDAKSELFFQSPPLLLVDGVVTRDQNHIAELNPLKVEKIDLIFSEYYSGVLKFKGLLNVVTEDGFCPITLPSYIFRQSYDFITPAETLEFPEYPDAAASIARIPDYRNTLYWDPDLRTDENGVARVEFYTSDDISDYVLKIRGITADGQTGFTSETISVTDH